MSLDLAAFAAKLERYRSQFQMSYEEVTEGTGISVGKLKSYEAGESEPSGDHVLVLADFFKCDYKFFISNEKLAPFEQTETLFRAHGEHLSPADRWAIQEFLYLCECEAMFTSAVEHAQRQTFSFRKKGNFYKNHGSEAAAALRAHLGYASNEVRLDLFSDFRKIGLHVFRRRLENSSISGLFIRHPVAGDCVLVNYTEDIYRQRFTMAHEAGHAILDTDREVNLSLESWDSQDLSEVRANVFASNYLMPPDFLSAIPEPGHWTAVKAQEWASKLKVSTHALSIALKRAKLIDSAGEQMVRQVRVPASEKQDVELPPSLSPKAMDYKRKLLELGLSSHYVGLCFDAYESGVISAGKLAESLLVTPEETREIAELFGRRLEYGD